MNKKTTQLSLVAGLLMFCAPAFAQSFTLKVQLPNIGDSLLVIQRDNGKVVKDTLVARKGSFSWSKPIVSVRNLHVMTPATYRNQDNVSLTLPAVPGEKAVVKGNKDQWTVSGSAFYQQYQGVHQMLTKAQTQVYSFINSLNKRIEAGENRDSVSKEYDAKFPALLKTYEQTLSDYIAQHANEDASATLVPEFEGYQAMKTASECLSNAVQTGRMKDFYTAAIDRAKAQMEEEERAKKVQASGVEAKDFTLNDINGKPLALSSLRGKYVILDFWGSWCPWCIKGFPGMKEYYKKYAGKFEILGVDCNDTEAKWKAAVKKYELPWLHVYCPRKNTVLSDYAIQGFPTKIIIDPEGKIVKTIVGEDPAFYTLLDELFGK